MEATLTFDHAVGERDRGAYEAFVERVETADGISAEEIRHESDGHQTVYRVTLDEEADDD